MRPTLCDQPPGHAGFHPDRADHAWRGVTVVTLAALAPLVGATVWGQVLSHPGSGWLTVDVALGVASWLGLAGLARHPVPTALALAALAVVSPAATPPATLALLHVSARRRLPVALAVAAAGIAAHTARGLLRPVGGLPLVWWLVVVIAAHAALLGWGALIRARQALLASLVERAQRAEAEQGRRVAEARAGERTRLAREMHDVLAHRLSLLATHAGAVEYRPDAPPQQLARAAGVIRETVHEALEELRAVIAVLREDDTGDDNQPLPTLADLPALLARTRAAGTTVTHATALPEGPPPAPVGRAAYRVVQEALTNAHRHATGAPVRLTVTGAPGADLLIDVVNPTPTSPTPATSPGSGMGLVGLTERVRLAGGHLDHQHVDGEFRLHAALPWAR
ncbi:sensor histidine kinase [Frankia sp. AgB32]|uniref:sensor histidine kinase n=1 Tax=Frankia sp. AgB32 TaxID=631119 RepID=UPI00200CCC5E|nr:histidine kinase [Frankia sp. AgB32]MCK9896757.1 histidine kinase [Frankia sp. AgB32]